MISLVVFLTAIVFAWIAVLFSRVFVKEEDVKRAIEIVNEYREAVNEAASRPRLKKKLRAMYRDYKRARNFLLMSSLKKMILLIIAYSVSSIIIIITVGTTVASPVVIPGATIVSNGMYYVPSVFVHFLGYIYALVLFRKDLII
ncbi:MAG: hypothetical protein GSR75_03250 [Desulfurococcales archaeon]|nr:hypothetical protein [Desulfurococcales archaeon]MEB3787107.1 hypothetical protein [Desulfurococcales archaeon]